MSERESLIERLRKLVETGKSYAKSELNGAPTSTFEIYMGHFAAITDEIAAALSSMEAGAEPVAFVSAEQLQALPADPADEGGAGYIPMRHTAAGKFQTPLYPSPASVPAGARVTDEMVEALKFYRDQWQTNSEGDIGGEPHLIRSWQEPTEELWTDAGRKAHEALAALAQPASGEGWRCFHCDEVFTSVHDARLHFGRDEGCTPACLIKGADGGLVAALRRAEDDAAEAWLAIHNETTDAAKGFHAQAARHREQLTAIEQVGYDRGIADAQAHPETLGLTWLPTSPREAEGEARTALARLDTPEKK